MKILLLNKHPVISKLVRLSAQKLDYEFDEQAHYADTLPLYDVIVVDDSVSADLKDLQNKCKKLICISSGATNLQSTPIILHKPFLPTDLIALMKDEEKPATQEEQTAEANAEEGVVDDTPLDLDSLSFDMADTTPQSTQPSENPSETPSEADTNIYLQDIKADAPESAPNDTNLDSLNVENSTTTADLSSQMADISASMDNASDSADFNLGVSTPDESVNSTSNDLNLGNLNLNASSGDLNLADSNLADLNLDLPSTDTNSFDTQTSQTNADTPNLDEGTSQSVENTAENVAENSTQEIKDEFSIEPIEFVETPLPTLESSTNSTESAEQTSDTNQESAQNAEFTSENLAQTSDMAQESVDEIPQQSANLDDTTALNDTNLNGTNEPNFQSVPDEELAFDSKDIADIMGLDEADTQPNANTPAQETTQSSTDTNKLADLIASGALDNAPQQDNDTQELLNELNEINAQSVDEANGAQENAGEGETAQNADENKDEVAQNEPNLATSEDLSASADDTLDEGANVSQSTQNMSADENAALVDEVATQENTQTKEQEISQAKAENSVEQKNESPQDETQAENLAEKESSVEKSEISAQTNTQTNEQSASTQNEAENSQEQMSEENAEISAQTEQGKKASEDENAEIIEQSKAGEDEKADENVSVNESANEGDNAKAEIAEQSKADESENAQASANADEKANADESESPLDLDFANVLQPLNEEPFSIEEKKEGKISFDDLPENAQFLGQKSEENVEADEVRPILLDEPKAQSTQDMVKEQLAALNAMDNEEQADDEGDESAENAGESELLAQLKGVSEKDLQIALGEIAPDDEAQSPLTKDNASANLAKARADESTKPKESAQNVASASASEVMDELSKGISGAITSSIKDDALKAALKGMNMHIDINIKFDEDKA